ACCTRRSVRCCSSCRAPRGSRWNAPPWRYCPGSCRFSPRSSCAPTFPRSCCGCHGGFSRIAPGMKIVITGGGGFIGSKLAKALLARGTLAAERIARLTLVDQAFPAGLPGDPRLATLGGDLPKVLDDSTTPAPQTSYGSQKVIGEYLVSDFSRKGYIDGRSLRLPTIVVRPGKPNAAASSFASAVVREPLSGIPYECPLPAETGVWLLSPRRVVEAFIHAHELPAPAWGWNRVVNLPGITVTVAEMIAAMGRIAGSHVAERVSWKPDARIEAIVKTWPVRFATTRAFELGFKADPGIEAVIRDYIADE